MEGDANMPTAITSRVNALPGNSPSKTGKSSTTTSKLDVTISAREK
jgi:hypothetical protein